MSLVDVERLREIAQVEFADIVVGGGGGHSVGQRIGTQVWLGVRLTG